MVTRPLTGTSIDWVFGNLIPSPAVFSIENSLTDHNIISCDLKFGRSRNENITRKWFKFDYGKFGNYLDDRLYRIATLNDPSQICLQLIDVFSAGASQSLHSTTTITSIRTEIAPWVTEGLLHLIKVKEKLLKARRKNRENIYLSDRLKRVSKIIKISNRWLLNNFYRNNILKCAGDIKKTWGFLNKVLGKNSSVINDVVIPEGGSLTTDFDKAAGFNNHFFNTIESIRNRIPNSLSGYEENVRALYPATTVMNFSKVQKEEVDAILNGLSINKSAGYDKITPKMLLCRREEVSKIITKMFNIMLDNGVYPNELKIHKIIPIPKGNGVSTIDMYRPVSLLPVIDKVLERIIFGQLSEYLDKNNILFEHQFGFSKGSGTEEAVVNVIEHICGGLDVCLNGSGVFFDLSKAFDLVDHEILIKKLRIIGVSNNSIMLLKDYLMNRRQFVQIGDERSSMLPVKCGVPQGSVLGPLLFKIYIDDIKNIKFFGKLIIFADDICLLYRYKYAQVLKTEIEYDAAILADYVTTNKLVLNKSKTKFIRFKPCSLMNDQLLTVYIDGVPITESEWVKYLGLTFSSNLQWDQHIDEIKSKISSAVGVLYKLKNKVDCRTKKLIYDSLIHSHLSYLPIAYGYKNTVKLKSLQILQNKALKLVYNRPLRSNTLDLFKNFAKNILPVRGLYKMQLLKFVFKSVNDIGNPSIQRNINLTNRNTRQSHNMNIARCRLELSKQRICFAGPKEFNDLPEYLRNISSLSTFKNELKRFLLQNLEALLA